MWLVMRLIRWDDLQLSVPFGGVPFGGAQDGSIGYLPIFADEAKARAFADKKYPVLEVTATTGG